MQCEGDLAGGWASIHDLVENFDGSDTGRARVLVGMYQAPEEEMRRSLRLLKKPEVEYQDASTLIVCPRNLVPMWQQQIDQYNLKAEIVSLSKAIGKLPVFF